LQRRYAETENWTASRNIVCPLFVLFVPFRPLFVPSGGKVSEMSRDFDQFNFDDVPILEMVKMFAHPDLPDGVGMIELSFTTGRVFIAVDDDTDNLICSRTLPEVGAASTSPFPAGFWDPIIGTALTTAWQMTNDRGYPDAVQLRFRALPNEGPYTIVQLYGEASQITLTEVKEIRQTSISRPSA
jgi:hypothetical protein